MHEYNEGGQVRSLRSGYCGVRALAIAAKMDWKDAEKHLREYARRGKSGNGAISKGMFKADYDKALNALGFKWCSAPKFEGRKARCSDLSGIVIARQAHHYVAVIGGVANDIWDCSDRMVYGYWEKS